MNNMIDYYEILEVSPKSGLEVIRAAYKVLLHNYYLEHDSEDQTEAQKLHLLNLAYDVLSDPDKRMAYDEDMGKTGSFHKEPARQFNSSVQAAQSKANESQANSNEVMVLFKDKAEVSSNASILSRLKWKRWGWSISILVVVAILISMVQPDPDKQLRGKAAVQTQVVKKELKAGFNKTGTDKQQAEAVENKLQEQKVK